MLSLLQGSATRDKQHDSESEDEKARKGLLTSLPLYIFFLVTVEDLQAMRGAREEERKKGEN